MAKPPNFREIGEIDRCASCPSFRKGRCSRFGISVERPFEYTCRDHGKGRLEHPSILSFPEMKRVGKIEACAFCSRITSGFCKEYLFSLDGSDTSRVCDSWKKPVVET